MKSFLLALVLATVSQSQIDKDGFSGHALAFQSGNKKVIQRWMFVEVNGKRWRVQEFGVADFRCQPGDTYVIYQYDMKEMDVIDETRPMPPVTATIHGIVPERPGVVQSAPRQPKLEFVPYVYADPQ